MKAQFRALFEHAFLNGIYMRGPVFAVIVAMNTVFIILGSLGLLTFATHITAVALGGVAAAIMIAFNIIGDIIIIRGIFSPPRAYLQALTPAPRWKMLLASLISMALMDIPGMAIVIGSQIWLSLNFTGFMGYNEMLVMAINIIKEDPFYLYYILYGILLLVAGYFLVLSIILFCLTAKRSIFYNMPASGFLSFLLGCLCFYVVSLSQLIFAPFGSVDRYRIFIIISIESSLILPVYILLFMLQAAVLFVITSKLLEKRINV